DVAADGRAAVGDRDVERVRGARGVGAAAAQVVEAQLGDRRQAALRGVGDVGVAVGVEAVAAALDRGGGLAGAAAERARRAGLRARGARAHALRAGRAGVAALGHALVDAAIAVVVEVVAGLGDGRELPGARAREHARGARLRADDAA